MSFARIIEWILLALIHKCRRESNAYQGEFIEFCYKFIECIEQNQIYLNFIVNMWKLSNAYTRLRILTHFGNHRLKRRKWINVKKYVHIRNNHQLDSRFLLRLFSLLLWLYFYHSLLILWKFSTNFLAQLSVIFVYILLCSYWIVSWHLLRGEIKKNSRSAGSLFSAPFFLPARAGGSTAKTTPNSDK